MARITSMPKDGEFRLIKMISRGMTNPEMAKVFGRSASVIIAWRRKFFLPRTLSLEDLRFRLEKLTSEGE